MEVPPALSWTLQIGSGVLWTAVYILIIRLGFRENTYGMPVPALCANVSWEFIFSLLYPHSAPQNYINITWLLFDLVIVGQTLHYGKRAFEPRWLFYPAFALGLVTSFAAIVAITYEFNDWDGKYSAFGQNLMMSILFVAMLLKRRDITGQSIYIALGKMFGTLLPSILFFLRFPESPLLNFLYLAIFTFDLVYLVLLHAKHAELGIDPWRRF
ncbi:MAG TPA: hypothetical protein VNO43_16005 [Candidatus Eisenbacteria bacterium]|nr:hypothetical protein [Candidatus Eisenbacteria bacterium]